MIALSPPKAEVRGSNPLGCANHFNDLGGFQRIDFLRRDTVRKLSGKFQLQERRNLQAHIIVVYYQNERATIISNKSSRNGETR